MKVLEEQPYVLESKVLEAQHQVFVHAMAYSEEKQYRGHKILFALLSGHDSSLQSIKAQIDIGTSISLKFGKAEKTIEGYSLNEDETIKDLYSEKGCYTKTNMNLSSTKKAVLFMHSSIVEDNDYVISLSENPATDIANLLASSKYGLHLLDEWKQIVFDELLEAKHLKELDVFFDDEMFEHGIRLYSVSLKEEEADKFIEKLLNEKKISFKKETDIEELREIKSLTDYLTKFSGHMLEKISNKIHPIHNLDSDEPAASLNSYPIRLFDRQAHVVTACSKRLLDSKSVILQGEMSTGKSFMMTAIADTYNKMKKREGYFASVLCPVSLTKKWPSEIKRLIPEAEVHIISKTKDLIEYHQAWTNQGRPKPTKPTFFVISFTTMRNDCFSEPAVAYTHIATATQVKEGTYFKSGFLCKSCGEPLKVVQDGNPKEIVSESEFSGNRRIENSKKPQNAFCSSCGDSLWTKKVINRYSSFKEWTKHEKQVISAIEQEDVSLYEQIQSLQDPLKSSTQRPRRVATIEYIRRKMKNFFNISIADEIHELKGGNTAQGNSLGALAAASKRMVGGTGTLFGGKAEDIYFLMWRLFPHEMVKSGFKYEEVTKFNMEYGNIEKVYYGEEEKENSNSHSKGGSFGTRTKVVPGISSFVYGQYLFKNVVNVRLLEVWENPVELIDVPTIFVEMPDYLTKPYKRMLNTFESAIYAGEDNDKQMTPLMMEYGISYPDNPFTFPDARFLTPDGDRKLIWKAQHLEPDITLPKEQKLMDIVINEMIEGRKSIVYVRDTGSTNPDRDVRPRLKMKLEEAGAKVCILDTTTTATNNRSEWLKQKIEEDYDVCIVSQSLVKVGLDLLCTPTLIYVRFVQC